jgi:hypothetical protein
MLPEHDGAFVRTKKLSSALLILSEDLFDAACLIGVCTEEKKTVVSEHKVRNARAVPADLEFLKEIMVDISVYQGRQAFPNEEE